MFHVYILDHHPVLHVFFCLRFIVLLLLHSSQVSPLGRHVSLFFREGIRFFIQIINHLNHYLLEYRLLSLLETERLQDDHFGMLPSAALQQRRCPLIALYSCPC
jgi:hypothetical protein